MLTSIIKADLVLHFNTKIMLWHPKGAEVAIVCVKVFSDKDVSVSAAVQLAFEVPLATSHF